MGIGTAVLLHVTYSLLGIGLLVAGSQMWFDAVKYAGAGYLAWLGVQSLRARPRTATPGGGAAAAIPGGHSAFATGFLTNALNPKASLFFIALFSVVIDPQRTPKPIQAAYGVWMALVTMAWFTIVSLAFTRDNVRRVFLSHGHWVDRMLGLVFLALALSLARASMP
ncbi:MAG: LysE family transporter [Opitutaceae bacterium]|nr:LysE family transporter [Opitutaceae bacterium]